MYGWGTTPSFFLLDAKKAAPQAQKKMKNDGTPCGSFLNQFNFGGGERQHEPDTTQHTESLLDSY
jgi:hypothetical protein